MGLAFLITSDNLQLLSERKVLKQAEYAAMLDAAGVIDAARAEAQRIEQQAHEQAQREREQAHADGLEQARLEQATQQIDAALQSQRQLGALRDAMARLVAKAVTQFVAEADPARVYQSALARVESLVRDEPFVSVRVAPGQEPTLRRALAVLRDAQGWMVEAAVQADASLPEGACVMHTASGTLDLGLKAQLEAFERALQRQQHAAQEADG